MNNNSILILGASHKPNRASNKAIKRLTDNGHKVYAIGRHEGTIHEVKVLTGIPEEIAIDVLSIYLNAKNQRAYYNRIINLKPDRIIFNPGAENIEFQSLLAENGLKYENACTLVLLSVGQL